MLYVCEFFFHSLPARVPKGINKEHCRLMRCLCCLLLLLLVLLVLLELLLLLLFAKLRVLVRVLLLLLLLHFAFEVVLYYCAPPRSETRGAERGASP